MHPPILSPYSDANEPKVIYVCRKSSFIGVVKRVEKLFLRIHKKKMARTDLIEGKGTKKQKLEALAGATAAAATVKDEILEEGVLLKATNMAIEKALSIALFLKERGDLLVQLKTGTVAVVDDIIHEGASEDAIIGIAKTEDEEEKPDTRVRYLSVLEVAITMK